MWKKATSVYMIIFLFFIFIGTLLRFQNPRWDGEGNIHPDEALIVNRTLGIRFPNQLNPGFHDYNGLTVYMLRIAAECTARITNNSAFVTVPADMTRVARFLSAIFASISVFLVYLLGKSIVGKQGAMLSALLFAFLPLHIQLAHMYTTDTFLVFFLLILCLSTVRFLRKPSPLRGMFMGIAAGLNIATKNTGYLFLALPVFAIITKKVSCEKRCIYLTITALFCVATFVVLSPYSFVDWPGYLNRSRYLADVIIGKLVFDWTMQFQQTNALFWIPNVFFAFGPAVPVLACLGMVQAIVQHKKLPAMLVILAIWCIAFFAFLSVQFVKFIRYLAPVGPLFAILAAEFISAAKRYRPWIGNALTACALIATMLWALAFSSIYQKEHSTVIASQWIFEHMAPGSRILSEEWNEIIRYNMPPLSSIQYQKNLFNFYTLPDDVDKRNRLVKNLELADYIIIESDKVERSVVRLSNFYPYSSCFYRHLDSGAIGFARVAQFSSVPHFGPIVISDTASEETFRIFDHPTITIYQKRIPYAKEALLSLCK